MKKLLLTIGVAVMLSCLALGAFACSNVNQNNYITVVARDYEQFTYTVYEQADDETNTLTPIGTYRYTFHRLTAANDQSKVNYEINGKTYELTSGGVIETVLDINAGKYAGDNVVSTVLFQNAYSPIASHKVYTAYTDGAADAKRSYESIIDYSGKKQVTISVKGENNLEKTFKKPSYCYDNDTLYSVVRGSDISRSSYSLSVAGVNNLQGGTRSVSIALVGTNLALDVPCMSAEPLVTTCVTLSTNAQYGTSTATQIYFVPSYRLQVGTQSIDLNKVPVRMDEGKYIYKLEAISVTE